MLFLQRDNAVRDRTDVSQERRQDSLLLQLEVRAEHRDGQGRQEQEVDKDLHRVQVQEVAIQPPPEFLDTTNGSTSKAKVDWRCRKHITTEC